MPVIHVKVVRIAFDHPQGHMSQVSLLLIRGKPVGEEPSNRNER
jgi:hypothetical protein